MNMKLNKKGKSNSLNFKYSLIASAIIGMSSISATAAESDTTKAEKELEVIEVRGQRGNLISAQNMKLNADTVMDAISSEDMGSLPDRSVLEAISRLPGVAIERFAAANDPDHFGVEGGGVVVRGLSQVRSEFNGRDSFSADSGRGLSFEDVSPELMGSVQVYKNQTADMIEGGIAGTVNLNTRKAFDSDGRVLAFSADMTYGDMREEAAPTFSGLFSDIWQLDSGRLGFLINYSKAEVKVRGDGITVGKFNDQARDENLLIPAGSAIRQKNDDVSRQGLATSLQWENTDNTLLLTGEFIRSESSLSWAENVIEHADDGNNIFPVGGDFEFDENGVFEKGILTSENGWRADGIPTRYGSQQGAVTRVRDEESVVNDLSFNMKYTPNDTWKFNFDVQYIKSKMEYLDVSMAGAFRSVVGMDLTGDVADLAFHGPGYDGQSDYSPGTPFTDPTSYYHRYIMDHISDNEGDEFATKFDVEYTFDEGEVKSLRFGLRYSDREQTTRQSDYYWKSISEFWNAPFAFYNENPSEYYEEVSFNDFFRGGSLNVEGGNSFLFPVQSLLKDYANLPGIADSLSENNTWHGLAGRDENSEGVGPTGAFYPQEINQTQESSTAAYIRLDFEGEIGEMDYSANVGLRYVILENETKGFLRFPDDIPDPDKANDANHFLPDDQKAFGNMASVPLSASSEYTNVLPSVNFKLSVSDDVLLRLAFSEAISLPNLGYLRNYVSIGGQEKHIVYEPGSDDLPEDDRIPTAAYYERYTASSGNPFLKPMEAYNYDVSLEWYFSEAGSLTGSIFHKDITNYFINGVTMRDYTNNGVTQTVQVQGPTNGDSGKIQGYEIAYQQFFDTLPGAFGGLGMSVNYTYINEQGSPNSGLSDDSPNSDNRDDFAFTDLPLEGLSKDTYNVAVLYEKYGLSARIAYGWRSEYLLTSREVNQGLPVYNNAGGQVDASLFWDVSDTWKIGIQGTNLNNNITETTMQIDQQGTKVARAWFMNDRRYSLIVRAVF